MHEDDKTEAERIGAAMAEAWDTLGSFHWLLGRGLCTADEPMFGFAIYADPDSTEEPLAAAEHDDPVECIRLAVAELHRNAN